MKIKVVVVFLFLIISCEQKLEPLLESDQNSYVFTSETDLLNSEYLSEIENFYNSVHGETFIGVDSIPIYYKIFLQQKDSKGAILISTGRTESTIKYKELIFDLYANGFSIYIHDHRGQGSSGRMALDREIGFVEDFQDYVIDMKNFYTSKVVPNKHEQVYLLAHSMGGAIGFSYLEQFPSDFKAAAFSSPMFGLGFIECSLGKAFDKDIPKYAPTQKNYLESRESFKNNTLTNCEVRFNLFSKAYMQEPLVRLGGVSLHWLYESCNQFDFMFQDISKIETPSLIFSAEEEQIVDPKAHYKFVKEATFKNKPIFGYSVKSAKHELFIENDAVRQNVLASILTFFESHSE
ncbi:alpha/beta fold hydrolase [Lutibacter holmesii]|uniref:Alpha/beta fold hydrolase n=1 Tax=Lutibacter holmesii TaxID=1137985 RepID=A0ABW3WQG3_9FLAO